MPWSLPRCNASRARTTRGRRLVGSLRLTACTCWPFSRMSVCARAVSRGHEEPRCAPVFFAASSMRFAHANPQIEARSRAAGRKGLIRLADTSVKPTLRQIAVRLSPSCFEIVPFPERGPRGAQKSVPSNETTKATPASGHGGYKFFGRSSRGREREFRRGVATPVINPRKR